MPITKDYNLGNWEYEFQADDSWIVLAHKEHEFYAELKRYGYYEEYFNKNLSSLKEEWGKETLL